MSNQKLSFNKNTIKEGCHSSSRIIKDDQYVCVCVCERDEGGGVEGDSQN